MIIYKEVRSGRKVCAGDLGHILYIDSKIVLRFTVGVAD